MEPGYVRDEENEDILMQSIFEHRDKDAAGGEGAGAGVDLDFEEFASQFLMDSGEGLLDEEEITPATSTTLHLEVYIWILYFVDHKMH